MWTVKELRVSISARDNKNQRYVPTRGADLGNRANRREGDHKDLLHYGRGLGPLWQGLGSQAESGSTRGGVQETVWVLLHNGRGSCTASQSGVCRCLPVAAGVHKE